MALTQSAWTLKRVKGGEKLMAQCTVTATTAETDAYTLKTPKELDTRKPFTLLLSFSASPDPAQVVVIDVWVGYDDDFALSGQGANVVATSGANFKQLIDDAILAITPVSFAFLIDPTSQVADVVTVAALTSGLKIKAPPAAYFAFNLDGASTLDAHTATYTIIQ